MTGLLYRRLFWSLSKASLRELVRGGATWATARKRIVVDGGRA